MLSSSTLATHLLACSGWGIHAYPHCHAMQPRHQGIAGRPTARCRSSKRTLVVRRGFGDDLLDYIQGMTCPGQHDAWQVPEGYSGRNSSLIAATFPLMHLAERSMQACTIRCHFLSASAHRITWYLLHAAGPKLRKWYGEGERMPRDGGNLGDDLEPGGPLEERAVVPRTAVLVTNADSPTAEQVVLQLILARCVRVL